jgi:hypothetical protein
MTVVGLHGCCWRYLPVCRQRHKRRRDGLTHIRCAPYLPGGFESSIAQSAAYEFDILLELGFSPTYTDS